VAEGKLTVGVEIDASKAFDGFADSVLRQLKPQLDKVQQDMQSAMVGGGGGGSGGGGGGGRWSQLGDIAAGSFIGALGSQLAVKGLAVIQDFASKAADAVRGILSGGWDRLVALDTAKTKMLALKVSAGDTEVVMKNALEAVKGTAFGLGDAATVAASALAAGVKPGKALTDYLKLTADTAAVARKAGQDMGVAFNEVGFILNKVTTQGYATNQELQMLSDRGLPIYQNLAKNLNLSAGEVIKLAEKSGVAASAVRAALEDTVGGAALKMGESFEGAMANAEAAFDRLGEALLKPFFQPVKDGVGGVTESVDQLTEIVTRNAPEIIRTVGGIATAFIEMSEFALKSLGDLLAGFGEIIAPLGDIQGAMLKFQAFQAEFRGDDELAEQLRADAEEAFGLGEGLQDLGNRLKAVDSDPLKNRINALTNELARGAEVNNAYTASQKALADAFEKGPQWGALLYQQQMMEWQNKVREANARGENGWSIPAPVRPGVGGGADNGGMPADVTRQSGAGSSGGGGKADAPLLFPPGTPIPSLGDLPKAGDDLTQSATALDDAADALTAAASSGVGGAGLGGMGGFGLNPQNVSLQGLQPQSLALLSLIQGMPQFASVPLTSGFRASDPYPWHPSGRGLDLGLNASDPIQSALGDQLKGFLETNKALFGINHVLWKVKDHFDHLHIGLN